MIRKLLIITIIWAIIILILSGIPGSSLPKAPIFSIPHLDKWIHAALYFPLAIFIVAEFDLSKKLFLSLAAPFFTMLIVALYGGMIELAQDHLFVNRSADVVDLAFDLFGGLFGITVYYLFLKGWFRRQPR